MHQALRILDKAMIHAQEAKALDETLAHTSHAHQLLYHQYAETMRMHVQEQQHVLLNELQGFALSERHGGSSLANAPTPVKTTPMQKTNGKKNTRERQHQKIAVPQVQTLSTSLQLVSNENPDC